MRQVNLPQAQCPASSTYQHAHNQFGLRIRHPADGGGIREGADQHDGAAHHAHGQAGEATRRVVYGGVLFHMPMIGKGSMPSSGANGFLVHDMHGMAYSSFMLSTVTAIFALAIVLTSLLSPAELLDISPFPYQRFAIFLAGICTFVLAGYISQLEMKKWQEWLTGVKRKK